MSNATNNIVSNSSRNARSPIVTHEQLAAQAVAATNPAATKKPAFKKAQLYINPGQWQEDEEGNPIFVSLPFGLGVDNMSKSAIRGGDKARHQQALSNALLDMLIDLGFDSLEPGQAMMLEGLSFELRWKRGDEAPEIDQERAKSVMSSIKLVPRVDAV